MLLVRHPDSYVPERRYVLDVVLGEFLGLPWRAELSPEPGFTITLEGEPSARSLRLADGLFALPADAWLSAVGLPAPPLRTLPAGLISGVSTNLPILHETGEPDLVEDDGCIRLGVDLLGAIFFQLTRYEELALRDRDDHGRFPAHASLAWRAGLLGRPVVDEQVAVLGGLIEQLSPRLPFRRPEFRQLISHDVDWPWHPRRSAAGFVRDVGADLVRRRSPRVAAIRGRAWLAHLARAPERDPYFTFDFIMDESERRGLRSAFYFMSGCTDRRFDPGYRLDAKPIAQLLRRIHGRGHEIGLHTSYDTWRTPERVAGELRTLQQCCERLGISQAEWGGRQHYLRWENPVTWRAWNDAGLAYDSSLGYAREPGFRCGTCHEFPVFDLLERQTLALRERPLVLMDLACLDPPPGHPATTLDELEQLRARCRDYGGDFTLLWHNSRLALSRERRLYRSAL